MANSPTPSHDTPADRREAATALAAEAVDIKTRKWAIKSSAGIAGGQYRSADEIIKDAAKLVAFVEGKAAP